MKGRSRLLLSVLFATLFYASMVSAYSTPDSDPFYEDNYAMNEEFYQLAAEDVKPSPEPNIETAPCTASMIYNDYVDDGYGMN